mmetsp:Transcript_11047/g.28292  ORF Transcript_11047/g.28292 Transcript_11047/m.28292 type:complete len:347 (+) Transcript_11047:3-1043(+)
MFEWLRLESEAGAQHAQAGTSEAPPAARLGTGGWWRPVTASPAMCDVAVVTAAEMDAASLVIDYVLTSRPVLIRGALDMLDRAEELRELWSRRSWLAAFGEVEMADVGVIPYAAQFGLRTESMRGAEFMARNMGSPISRGDDGQKSTPPYHFVASESTFTRPSDGTSVRFGVSPHFARGLIAAAACRKLWRPPHTRPDAGAQSEREAACWQMHLRGANATALPSETIVQTYIGGHGSGAPWHFHSTAFNWLVYGRKTWRLRPPASRLYAVRRELSQTDSGEPTAVAQCVQEAGDALFIPRQWAHAVDNEGDVLGFALEIGEPNDDLDMILSERFPSPRDAVVHDEL